MITVHVAVSERGMGELFSLIIILHMSDWQVPRSVYQCWGVLARAHGETLSFLVKIWPCGGHVMLGRWSLRISVNRSCPAISRFLRVVEGSGNDLESRSNASVSSIACLTDAHGTTNPNGWPRRRHPSIPFAILSVDFFSTDRLCLPLLAKPCTAAESSERILGGKKFLPPVKS